MMKQVSGNTPFFPLCQCDLKISWAQKDCYAGRPSSVNLIVGSPRQWADSSTPLSFGVIDAQRTSASTSNDNLEDFKVKNTVTTIMLRNIFFLGGCLMICVDGNVCLWVKGVVLIWTFERKLKDLWEVLLYSGFTQKPLFMVIGQMEV